MKLELGIAVFGVVIASIFMPGAVHLVQWLGVVDPQASVFTYALWLYFASVTISAMGAFAILAFSRWLSSVTASQA
jgi:hypothetical protein